MFKTDDRRLRQLQSLACALDELFPIPGTRIRFGLDALLGLIPGAGDSAGMILSGIFLLAAARYGVPVRLTLRMALNIGIELVIGAVPLVGDFFDIAWKANIRNVRLLEDYLSISTGPPRSRWKTWLVSLLALLILLGVIGLIGYLTVMSIRWLIG
jgi:hypothetical protein